MTLALAPRPSVKPAPSGQSFSQNCLSQSVQSQPSFTTGYRTFAVTLSLPGSPVISSQLRSSTSSYLPNPVLSCKTAVSNLFGARDWFHRRQFPHSPGVERAWFCTGSRSLRLSCTLSLVLFHQRHLRSSGTGSRRLGNASCKVQSLRRFQGQDGGSFGKWRRLGIFLRPTWGHPWCL